MYDCFFSDGKPSTYTVTGVFVKGKSYKCTFKGNKGESSNTVTAQSTTTLACGEGPTNAISSDFTSFMGYATLQVTQGSTDLPGTPDARRVKYTACGSSGFNSDYVFHCESGVYTSLHVLCARLFVTKSISSKAFSARKIADNFSSQAS